MKPSDVVGFLLLALGVGGVILGIGALARDMHLGWLGIIIGIAMNVLAYRMMIPKKEEEQTRTESPVAGIQEERASIPVDSPPKSAADSTEAKV